jgi:hypothetical protein
MWHRYLDIFLQDSDEDFSPCGNIQDWRLCLAEATGGFVLHLWTYEASCVHLMHWCHESERSTFEVEQVDCHSSLLMIGFQRSLYIQKSPTNVQQWSLELVSIGQCAKTSEEKNSYLRTRNIPRVPRVPRGKPIQHWKVGREQEFTIRSGPPLSSASCRYDSECCEAPSFPRPRSC